MTKRILLYATTNWPSAARYAGGFQAAGLDVHAAAPAEALVRASRYVGRVHDYKPLRPLNSLRRAIEASAPDLIVACDDRAIAHLVKLHRVSERKAGDAAPLAELIARSLGRPENYARVISRAGSLNEMKACGVRVPETLAVAGEAAVEAGVAKLGLPVVLKADGSWGGDGVVVAKTREEALAAYRRLSRAPSRLRSLARALRRRDAHFLLAALAPAASPVCLQEFIAGRPAASAFAAKDGRLLAKFHYDVLVAEDTIGPPSVVRRVEDEDMDAAGQAAASCFGLSGLHGLDFIRDAEGRVHLIEINPRATQGGTLPFGEGRDLPAALAATLVKGPVGRRLAIDNDIVAFFPREIRRDPNSSYLIDGHHDIPQDDPGLLAALTGGEGARKPGRLARFGGRAAAALASLRAVAGKRSTVAAPRSAAEGH